VVLVQAHVARARVLVITAHEAFKVRKMIEIATALNPGIRILARASSEDEAKLLRAAHAEAAFVPDTELARALA
jgi:CPA2 family monovalent cation:H+ antiporter-2